MRAGLEGGGRTGRQGPARLHRILRVDMRILGLGHHGQRTQRQAVADGGIARHQKQPATAQLPLLRAPTPILGLALPALDRNDIAPWLAEPELEDLLHPRPLLRVGEPGVERIDIIGKLGLLEQPVRRYPHRLAARNRRRARAFPTAPRPAPPPPPWWRRLQARDRAPVEVPGSRAISPASRQIGWPSWRQYSANAQRGRLSPGYHLPWP